MNPTIWILPFQCPETVQNSVRQNRDDYEDYNNPTETPTEKSLVRLHVKVIKTTQTYTRTQVQWAALVEKAFDLEDIEKNEGSTSHSFQRTYGQYTGALSSCYNPTTGKYYCQHARLCEILHYDCLIVSWCVILPHNSYIPALFECTSGYWEPMWLLISRVVLEVLDVPMGVEGCMHWHGPHVSHVGVVRVSLLYPVSCAVTLCSLCGLGTRASKLSGTGGNSFRSFLSFCLTALHKSSSQMTVLPHQTLHQQMWFSLSSIWSIM